MSLRQIDKFVKWNEQAQQYLPVLWRREVLPSWLTFTQDSPLPITVPAFPAPTPLLTFKQPYSSVNGNDQNLGTPFEVRSLVFQDSTAGTLNSNFTVLLKEVGEARNFMNAPVHVRTMFGTGQLPGLLREPYMFMSQHNISLQAQNIAGLAPTSMRMYLCGAQYYPWSPELLRYRKDKQDMTALLQKWLNRRRYVMPYWQTTDTPVVLPDATPTDFFAKISDDGHFEAFGHSVVTSAAAVVPPVNPFIMTISEVKTKQTLMNGQISQFNGIGDARFPTMYPTPYLIPAGYRLRITITNTSGAPLSVWLTFFGRKIYSPFTKVAETLVKTAVPTPADSMPLMVPKPLP